VKSILLLSLLAAFALSACTTLSNRRDLYRPGKPGSSWNSYGEWEKKEKAL
jgi:hypothetical protein